MRLPTLVGYLAWCEHCCDVCMLGIQICQCKMFFWLSEGESDLLAKWGLIQILLIPLVAVSCSFLHPHGTSFGLYGMGNVWGTTSWVPFFNVQTWLSTRLWLDRNACAMLFLTHASRPVARWCATHVQPQTFSPGRPEMQRAHPLFRWWGPYCTSQRSQEPQLVKFHGFPPILVGLGFNSYRR